MARTAQGMWVLEGGHIFTAASDMVPGDPGTIEMVIPMFLIEHDDGNILIDTGLAPEAALDADGVYADLRPAAIVKSAPHEQLPAQLAAIGKSVADVTHVVISHGHFDHCGGLALVPDVPVLMNAREWTHICAAPKGRCAPVRSADFDGFDEGRLQLFEGDLDVFGDGSVTILATPGHTPGNCSVLVRLPSRTILLSEDAAHVRRGYEVEAIGHIDTNPDDVGPSIRRLKALGESLPAEEWVTHDYGDWKRLGGAGRHLT